MAYDILKNISKASHGVLKGGCTIYNCTDTAVCACNAVQYATALYGASGAAMTICTVLSDFRNFTGHECTLFCFAFTGCFQVTEKVQDVLTPGTKISCVSHEF